MRMKPSLTRGASALAVLPLAAVPAGVAAGFALLVQPMSAALARPAPAIAAPRSTERRVTPRCPLSRRCQYVRSSIEASLGTRIGDETRPRTHDITNVFLDHARTFVSDAGRGVPISVGRRQ